MRSMVIAAGIATGLISIARASGVVSMESLLAEMTDDGRLAQWPEVSYQTLQASSYDRGSKVPGQAGWFANADWSHFIRMETNQNRVEHVMMEDNGPGAVVRFWNTWFGPQDGVLNHSTDGTIRIYLDGNPDPVVAARQSELLVEKTIIKPPFSETAQPDAPPANRCYSIHLPIPYAKGCKITYETRGKLSTQWNKGEANYYQVNYRKYAPGTAVKTFQLADLKNAGPLIAETGRQLLSSQARAMKVTSIKKTLKPGGESAIRLKGASAIREIRFKLDANLTPDELAAALRFTEVQLEFDGTECASLPVGYFFATGTRIANFKTRFIEATADKTLVCRWVMPFAKTARVRFVNHGKAPVTYQAQVATTKWTWDGRSMHFHAISAPHYEVQVTPQERGARDMNFASLFGQGRLVGDTLAVVNNPHNKAGDSWWGEGDEKIYVNGEAFPSHFGTGTEDYYGYSHCRPEAFSSPFHAQPYGDGNMWPQSTTASQSSVNTRVRLLDDIPFTKSLRFDMELWHWKHATMDFVPTTYFYLKPGNDGKQKLALLISCFPEDSLDDPSLTVGAKSAGETRLE